MLGNLCQYCIEFDGQKCDLLQEKYIFTRVIFVMTELMNSKGVDVSYQEDAYIC